jgi:hypothetical protein
MFLARNSQLGRAEEAFRKSVSLDGSHLDSLLALCCVLWHNGVHTDPLYLEDATTVRAHSTLPLLSED